MELVPMYDALHENHKVSGFPRMQKRYVFQRRNLICIRQDFGLSELLVVKRLEKLSRVPGSKSAGKII